MTRLHGKVCLVTGAGGAIGRATVKAFKDEGAIVVGTDIKQDLLGATVQATGIEGLQQDVTNEAQWDEIVSGIESRHGRLDVLVNNAGILGSVENVNPEWSIQHGRSARPYRHQGDRRCPRSLSERAAKLRLRKQYL